MTLSGRTITVNDTAGSFSLVLASAPTAAQVKFHSDGGSGTDIFLTADTAVPTDTAIPSETISVGYSNDGAIALAGLSVSVSNSDALSTVLNVNHGTISVGTISGVTISGNGTGSATISGSKAQINNALSGAIYTPNSGYTGTDTLGMTTTDTVNDQSTGTETAEIVNGSTDLQTWIGGVGGDWSNPAKWSPSGVPAEGEVVTINSGSAIIEDAAVPELGSLSIGTGGSLTVDSPYQVDTFGSITNNGTINLAGGTLRAANDSTFVNNGLIAGYGTVFISARLARGRQGLVAVARASGGTQRAKTSTIMRNLKSPTCHQAIDL